MATEKIRIDYIVIKKQLDASNKSLAESAKRNNLLQQELDETNKKFKNQEKQLGKTNKLFAGLGGQLTALGNRFQIAGKGVGDMAANMFKTTTATTGATKAMKLLRVAVMSTGIGALVIALTSLIAYFTKTQKGSDLLSKAMGAMGATVDVIIGKLAIFGEKLVKVFSDPKKAVNDLTDSIKNGILKYFTEFIPNAIKQVLGGFALLWDAAKTLDFEKAKEGLKDIGMGMIDLTPATALLKVTIEAVGEAVVDVKEGFTDLATEIKGAINDSNDYEDMVIRLREREIEVTAAVARRSRIIQEQLIITRDMTKSFAEQKAALDLANNLELANERDLLDLANQRFALAEKDMANTPVELRNDEQKLAIATATAAVETAIATSTAKQREILNRQVELENRRLAAVRAVAVEEAKILAQKEKFVADSEKRINDKIEAGRTILFEEELIRIKEHGATKLEIKLFELEEAERLEKEAAATSIEDATMRARAIAIIEAKFAEQKKQAVVDESAEGWETIKGLTAQGLEGMKEAAIFTTLINTKDAAVAAYKSVVGIPVVGPGLAPLAAAAAAAFGLRSVAEITNTNLKFEKGGRIGGELHSGGGTLIEAERDEFMMSRKATSKYGFDLMNKINNLELNDLTLGGDGSSINIIDTKAIADQLKDMPQNIINVDSEGFALHQRRGQYMMSQKIERYST